MPYVLKRLSRADNSSKSRHGNLAPQLLERSSPLPLVIPAEVLVTILDMTVACYHARYELPGDSEDDDFESDSERLEHWKSEREDNWAEQLKAAYTVRSASQVSRFWRRTALGCKRIWGMILDIDFNSYEWVVELIRRSNNAPLFVRSVYCPGDDHARFAESPKWKAIFDQVHRWGVLQVAFNGDDDIEPLRQMLGKPMPLLKSLHLENNNHQATEDQGWDGECGPLTGYTTPILQSLVLNAAIISRPADLSRFMLVHLEISIDKKTPYILSPNYLLDVLAGQPTLETFRYHDSRTMADGDEYESKTDPRNIHLPLLQSLELWAFEVVVDVVFCSLTIPGNCNVDLHRKSRCYPELDGIDNLLNGIGSFLENWKTDSKARTSWALEGDSIYSFRISLGIAADQVDFEDSEIHVPKFSLRFQNELSAFEGFAQVPNPPKHLADILDCIIKTPAGKADVKVMKLDLRKYPWYKDPTKIHSRLLSTLSESPFTTVEELHVGDEYVKSLVNILLSKEPSSSDPVIFPCLQTVFVQRHWPWGVPDEKQLDALASLLRTRAELQKPISQALVHCDGKLFDFKYLPNKRNKRHNSSPTSSRKRVKSS